MNNEYGNDRKHKYTGYGSRTWHLLVNLHNIIAIVIVVCLGSYLENKYFPKSIYSEQFISNFRIILTIGIVFFLIVTYNLSKFISIGIEMEITTKDDSITAYNRQSRFSVIKSIFEILKIRDKTARKNHIRLSIKRFVLMLSAWVVLIVVGVFTFKGSIFNVGECTFFDQIKLIYSINKDEKSNEFVTEMFTSYEKYNFETQRYNIVLFSDGENSREFLFFKDDIFQYSDAGKFEVTYYKYSKIPVNVVEIEEEKPIPSVPITLTPALDENGCLKKDVTYFIERTEIEDYEDLHQGLYWYVTKNGDFFEADNATMLTKTNFPTFYKRGEYEVTLAINYNEETGEYTPISNTIEFRVE